MYVVAGVTGNTGSVVAERILEAGKPLRVVVRDEAKAAPWKDRGAQVAVADLSDSEALTRALEGAEGVYALNPPAMQDADPLGHSRQVVSAWLGALKASGAKKAVFLSSVGAQHPQGTGVIRSVHGAESVLRDQPVPVTFLRAAYFMENWGMSLGPALAEGTLYSFLNPQRAIPMVATADIGRVAAQALLEEPSTHRVIELAGPRAYSPQDVATMVAEIAGKPVSVAQVPREQIVGMLTSFGISRAVAELYVEMVTGIDSGHVAYEGPEASVVHGKVELHDVLRSLAGRLAAD
jgi:NAD(P)H dehydrogenase (quinone)